MRWSVRGRYEEAHLPGAINIPYDRVDELAPRLLPDKGAQIVFVYCSNSPCRSSAIASSRLSRLGYEDVRDYHEGKQDWIEAGLPTERAAGRRSPAKAFAPDCEVQENAEDEAWSSAAYNARVRQELRVVY